MVLVNIKGILMTIINPNIFKNELFIKVYGIEKIRNHFIN